MRRRPDRGWHRLVVALAFILGVTTPTDSAGATVVVGLYVNLPASLVSGSQGAVISKVSSSLRHLVEGELRFLGVTVRALEDESPDSLDRAGVRYLLRISFLDELESVWIMRTEVEDLHTAPRLAPRGIQDHLPSTAGIPFLHQRAVQAKELVRRAAGIKPTVIVGCFGLATSDPDVTLIRVLLPTHLPDQLMQGFRDRGQGDATVTGLNQSEVTGMCGNPEALAHRTKQADFTIHGILVPVAQGEKIEVTPIIYRGDIGNPVKPPFVSRRRLLVDEIGLKASELGKIIMKGWPK